MQQHVGWCRVKGGCWKLHMWCNRKLEMSIFDILTPEPTPAGGWRACAGSPTAFCLSRSAFMWSFRRARASCCSRAEQSQLLQHHLLRVCRRRVDLQGRHSATDGCHVTPCRPVNSGVCDFAEHHRRQRRSSLFGFKADVLVFVNSCSELKINPFEPILSEWKTKIVFVLNLAPGARFAPNSVIEMQLCSRFQLQLRFLDKLSQGQSVTRWKHTHVRRSKTHKGLLQNLWSKGSHSCQNGNHMDQLWECLDVLEFKDSMNQGTFLSY